MVCVWNNPHNQRTANGRWVNDMKIVKIGESTPRTTTVINDVVTVNHVTKHNTLGQCAMAWHFDFAHIDRETLMRVATRALVIDARPVFKKCPQSTADDWNDREFNVGEMLTRQRRGADPVTAAKSNWDKMDVAQRRVYLTDIGMDQSVIDATCPSDATS